jgi:signal peptidase I
MKKLLAGTCVSIGALFVVWAVARLFGFIGWYNIPSPSNEPALMVGAKVFVTNLKKPALHNLITYTNQYTDSAMLQTGVETKGQTYVHRLCGMPGDVLEMKNSVLYVNGENFDEELDLKKAFFINSKDMDKIDEGDLNEEKGDIRQMYNAGNTYVIIVLDEALRNKYQKRISLTPYYAANIGLMNDAFKWHDKNATWTVDNFGPLKIPEGKCFVMGDNRHNSLDSRYTGYVAVEDISGVVFYNY